MPAHLLDIDTSMLVTQSVLVSQLGHNGDGVQSRVLSKCRRDNLESFRESLETVCFFALERLRVLRQ